MSRWDFVRGPDPAFEPNASPQEIPGVVIDLEYLPGLLLVFGSLLIERIGLAGDRAAQFSITINGLQLGTSTQSVVTHAGFLQSYSPWQVQTFAGGRARIAYSITSIDGAGVHRVPRNDARLFVLSLPQLERESIP